MNYLTVLKLFVVCELCEYLMHVSNNNVNVYSNVSSVTNVNNRTFGSSILTNPFNIYSTQETRRSIKSQGVEENFLDGSVNTALAKLNHEPIMLGVNQNKLLGA